MSDDTNTRLGRLEINMAKLTTAVAVHSEKLRSYGEQIETYQEEISGLKTSNAVMNARIVIYTGAVSGLFSAGMALLVSFLSKH